MSEGNITVAALNAMSPSDFVRVLGGVFEHSPWVAEGALAARPFADALALHAAMVGVVERASMERKIALLNAHPELAGKEADAGALTAASTAEQKGAGLINLSPDEKARIQALNARYRANFGFPFIIAVREHTRAGIFAAFERRVENARDAEIAHALSQVYAITRMRLERLVHDPTASTP